MAILPVYQNMVAFVAQSLPERFFRVERQPVLVKISLLQVFADAHKSAVRLQSFGQKLDESGFAGAVRADNADFVAFNHPGRKVFDNFAFAETLANMLGLNNQLGAKIAFFHVEIDAAGLFNLIAPFGPQLLQFAQPSHIAFAPGSYAFVQPFGFFFDFFVEVMLLNQLLIDNLLLPLFKKLKAFVVAMHNAAVKPESRLRGIVEKHPVVRNQHHRPVKGFDDFLKFFDGRHVEVVGRFVQKQNVRFRNQRLSQGGLAFFAAGSACHRLLLQNAQLPDKNVGLVFQPVFVGRQSGQHHVAQGGKPAEVGVLRHIGDFGSRLNENFSVIGFQFSGNNFQQGGLSAAVAPHQADFVSPVDVEFHIAKQLIVAKGQTGRFYRVNWRLKHLILLFL